MALVGRLEDLNLTELFHLLSLFQKSGKLTLTSNNQTGIFVFKSGKIVHATNGRKDHTLGDILLHRKLIAESTLKTALLVQRQSPTWERLGTILVEMSAITPELLEGIIREQLQEVAKEFLHWESGFFSFKPFQDLGPDSDTGDGELELAGGMNTDQFILEIITKLEQVQKRSGGLRSLLPGQATKAAAAALAKPEKTEQGIHELLDYMVDPATYSNMREEPSGSPVQEEENTDIPDPAGDLSDLRSLMVEIQLRSPSFTGEITLMILRYATQVVNRGLLCHVSPEGISGIGQFGIEDSPDAEEPADRRIQKMRFPCHEPSVFFEVIEKMQTYRGPLKRCKWNLYLTDQLGGQFPREVVAIPIVVDGMIIAIFYGDNLPDGRPIGSVQGIELLMIEAGLAIEKKLLRAKLRQVEAQVRELTREKDAAS